MRRRPVRLKPREVGRMEGGLGWRGQGRTRQGGRLFKLYPTPQPPALLTSSQGLWAVENTVDYRYPFYPISQGNIDLFPANEVPMLTH